MGRWLLAVCPNPSVSDGKDFAADKASVKPTKAVRALIELAGRRSRPKQTPYVLFDLLVEKHGIYDLDEIVRLALEELEASRDGSDPGGARR